MSAETPPLVEIYGLFTTAVDGTKAFFYVGRSENVGRRLREHLYASRDGHEDKYVRIRELDAAGTPWHIEVIESLDAADYYPDAERWHVIRLTRDGHSLTNMRHGSVAHLAELAEQVHARQIRNVADVRADRERREDVRKYRASRKLHRAIWTAELLVRGIPDLAKDMVLPGVFRRKLLAYYKEYANADSVCLRPMSVQYLCFLALTPISQAKRFRELERDFPNSRPPKLPRLPQLPAQPYPGLYVVTEPRDWEGQTYYLTERERAAKRTRLRALKGARIAQLQGKEENGPRV
jgi:hypothetical protein